MGIKDLYKVIQEHGSSGFVTHHLSEFSGYRFAIDISVFLYKYIRTAGPDRWVNSFILLLCTLKRYGIKAVCIFDGPNPPIEKREEQNRRRSENEKALNRLEECRRMKEHFVNDYDCESTIDDEVLDETAMLVGKKREIDRNSFADIIDALSEVIERLEHQTLPITPEYGEKAFKIVQMMGLGAIKALGEAETLCAYLAVTGKVDAVLTEDTDVLAYGTPIMVAFKDYKLGEDKVHAIHTHQVLEEMELEQREFTDLCILLSCDYNSRVKGFPPDGKKRKKAIGIGTKGAVAMIQEYRRLEEVEKHVEDIGPLKYRRCRELFTIPQKVENAAIPLNTQPEYAALEKFIRDNKVVIKLEYIKDCYRPAELVFDLA